MKNKHFWRVFCLNRWFSSFFDDISSFDRFVVSNLKWINMFRININVETSRNYLTFYRTFLFVFISMLCLEFAENTSPKQTFIWPVGRRPLRDDICCIWFVNKQYIIILDHPSISIVNKRWFLTSVQLLHIIIEF